MESEKQESAGTNSVFAALAGGGLGYLLGSRSNKRGETIVLDNGTAVEPPILIDPATEGVSVNIGYITQTMIRDILFEENIDYAIKPATADILFVDCIFSEYNQALLNNPQITPEDKVKLDRHCANLISGICTSTRNLEVESAVLLEYSFQSMLASSSLVHPLYPAYRQPFGDRRRRLGSRKIRNVVKYLTYALNDLLRQPAFTHDGSAATDYLVGQYVAGQSQETYSDYVTYLHEKLKSGTLILPPVSPVHAQVREAIKTSQKRRIFVNPYNNLLLVDYADVDVNESMYNKIFTILKYSNND